MSDAPRAARSKTLATWLALLGGGLGLHRFYLHGWRDVRGWLHPLPTLAGAYGFWRMREFGVDDPLGSWLVPLLGAMLAASMLTAIVYGLTDESRWTARHGRSARAGRSNWLTIVAVALALALGATATMATIAFVAGRFFESRALTAS
jgi:hypothetical protein